MELSRIETLIVARNTHLDICHSAQDAWPWAKKSMLRGTQHGVHAKFKNCLSDVDIYIYIYIVLFEQY